MAGMLTGHKVNPRPTFPQDIGKGDTSDDVPLPHEPSAIGAENDFHE